jgi:hypothetical protein
MTISVARIIGAACAAVIACVLVSMTTLTAAQSAPLSLAPTAANTQKAAPRVIRVQRDRKTLKRNPIRTLPTDGNADLAFLSAGQYLDVSANDSTIPLVAENEFSLLDFSAGTVRVVDPDELTEVDLANDPLVLLAQNRTNPDARPVQEVSAAPPRTDQSDEDDGVFNRILMTFAGALAMASAMRMILA